jgi:hypothetical protein
VTDDGFCVGVRLEAPPLEAEVLCLLFPSDPLVKMVDGKLYLFGSALDDARDGGSDGFFPEDVVQLLLPRIMTIARSQLSDLWRVTATGDWIGYRPGARIRVGSVRLSVGTGLPPGFVADAHLAAQVLQVADQERVVADALRFVNGAQGLISWVDAYKVCEILIDHVVGGKQTLNGWSSNKFSTIMECAGRWQVAGDGARHYRQKGNWSGRRIQLGEATDLLASLVLRWVREAYL